MRRISILVPVLVLLGGCLESEDDVVDFAEDFEACGVCNWEVSGDVEVVTTVHPGEHAARLGAGAMMRHLMSIERSFVGGDDEYDYDGNFSDGNWIEFSTDCGGTPGLVLEPFGTNLVVRTRLAAPVNETFSRRKLMFPALPPYDDETTSVRFTQLVIETGAPCRIDSVRLMVSGGTLGY